MILEALVLGALFFMLYFIIGVYFARIISPDAVSYVINYVVSMVFPDRNRPLSDSRFSAGSDADSKARSARKRKSPK
jgi:hypothetical protein